MFGWLKSLFGNETVQERIIPPPLPSKVKKAEKLVSKKVAKKAGPKTEVTKKEVSKEEAPKVKTAKVKAPSKKKEEVKLPVDPVQSVDPAPKKKNVRSKKPASVEPVQKEQN